jgi:predicted RNase H-like HicB family nuclease
VTQDSLRKQYPLMGTFNTSLWAYVGGKLMENKYEIIIYWSQEDRAFIAEVPELAGCMADGKTYQEALANTEVVIQEWIETMVELNRPILQPKGKLMYA